MIQSISNGYYGYQNMGNTSSQMYNATPIFSGQVQPNADTVQFSTPQKKKEGSFIENNIGKILIGAGLLAVIFATHGKGAKAVEETTPHLPPIELPPHTPVDIAPLDDTLNSLESTLGNHADDMVENLENTSSKIGDVSRQEIREFLASHENTSLSELQLKQTEVITNDVIPYEEKFKQENLYEFAIRRAKKAEREAAKNIETLASTDTNAVPKRTENTTPLFEPTLSQWEQSRESFARSQSRIIPEKYEYHLRLYESLNPRPKA